MRDGYDTWILIKLRDKGRLDFSRIMSEMTDYEIKWSSGFLKGKSELIDRLNGLIEGGLIKLVGDECNHYQLTEKGRGEVTPTRKST